MKKNKKIIIASVIIILVIITISAITFVLYNNSKQVEDSEPEPEQEQGKISNTAPKITVSQKVVENENIKVNLEKITAIEKYWVIEYDVDIKVEDENLESKVGNQVSFELPRNIKIGSEEIVNMDDDRGAVQLAYKENENNIKVYDVIDISDKELNKNKHYLKIEIIDPYSDYENDENSKKIGTLVDALDQKETSEKVSVIEENKTQKNDNVTTTVDTIIKTDNATFIIGKITMKNVSEEQFANIKSPQNLDINVLDQNGDTIIDVKKSGSSKVYDENGEEIIGNASAEDIENYTFEAKYLFGLFDDELDNNQVKICPYFTNTVSVGQYINNKKAYSIEEQNNSEENDNGGKVEVTKVQKGKNEITIYFTQTGFVDNQSMVLIRNDDNYETPYKIEKIKENQYKAEFSFDEEEYDRYVILEENEVELIGEGIDIEIQ